MIRVENVYYQEDAIIKRENGKKVIIELNGAVFRLQNFVDTEITDLIWNLLGEQTIYDDLSEVIFRDVWLDNGELKFEEYHRIDQ